MEQVVVNENVVAESEKKQKSPMTLRQFYEAVMTGTPVVNGMKVVDKAAELLVQMDNSKAKAKAKPSKAKEESKPLQEKILAFLNTQTASVCTKEIAAAVGSTSPKCTSALKFLVEDGLVNKLDLGRNKPYEYIVK